MILSYQHRIRNLVQVCWYVSEKQALIRQYYHNFVQLKRNGLNLGELKGIQRISNELK